MYKRKYTPRRRYKRKTYAKRTAKVSKPMRKAVKKVIRSQMETKICYTNDGAVPTMVFSQNEPYTVNLLSSILQGTSSVTRVGDKINVQYITFSTNLYAVPVSTIYWNVYLFRSSEYRNATPGFSTNISYSGFFKNITNNSNIDIPDHEKVTVLKHRTYKMEPSNDGGQQNRKAIISFNMKGAGYQYDSENGNIGKNGNLYVLVIADQDQGCGFTDSMTVVKYKDA